MTRSIRFVTLTQGCVVIPLSPQTSRGCRRIVNYLCCFHAFRHHFCFERDPSATSLLIIWIQTCKTSRGVRPNHPESCLWQPVRADASGNVQEKGKFRFILPLPWASSFWQAELKDVFVSLYLISLKTLFWSQSVQSLFDCILILAFMASSSNQLHGLIMCVC